MAAPSPGPPPPTARSRGIGEGARLLFRVLRANPLTFIGFLLVAGIAILSLLVVVAPHLVVPYGARQVTGAYDQPPSPAHWFGTDGTSFDIFSNVLRALPLDVGIGVFVAGISLLGGGALGLIAGYFDRPWSVGGVVSVAILRLTDIFLSFPSLILALAISVSLGRGVWQTIFAVSLTWWPYYVRLVRGEVLAVKHLPYVTAARAAGVREGRIILRHVLRNILEPLVVYFTLDVGTVLVTFSTIGFVARAIPYPGPSPEWGSMLSYYQNAGLLNIYPWEVLAPGLAIFVTVLSFSLLGDGLRDLLDPRTRRAFVRSSALHDPPAEPRGGSSPAGSPAALAEPAVGA